MNLSELRKTKDITMVKLAAHLGISQGYYSRLERGQRRINNELMNRIAAVLGEPVTVIEEAARSNAVDSVKLKSWMSNIRINGLPFIRAFHYYVESKNLEASLNDDIALKKMLKDFIESNIGFSVLAEMSENKALLQHIREKIGVKDIIEEKVNNDHEQIAGTTK